MKKTWFLALEHTIFQLACLHVVLIAFQAVRTADYKLLHLSSIMDLGFFMQNPPYSFVSNLLLFIPIVALFFLNFRRSK